jgi:hypothetical protein
MPHSSQDSTRLRSDQTWKLARGTARGSWERRPGIDKHVGPPCDGSCSSLLFQSELNIREATDSFDGMLEVRKLERLVGAVSKVLSIS